MLGVVAVVWRRIVQALREVPVAEVPVGWEYPQEKWRKNSKLKLRMGSATVDQIGDRRLQNVVRASSGERNMQVPMVVVRGGGMRWKQSRICYEEASLRILLYVYTNDGMISCWVCHLELLAVFCRVSTARLSGVAAEPQLQNRASVLESFCAIAGSRGTRASSHRREYQAWKSNRIGGIADD
jgi:hypothetical protein